MEKKLIAQGPKSRKSYTVTLPLEWVKRETLDQSRLVDLEVYGHKVVISSKKEFQERKVIDTDKVKDVLMKVIPMAYRLGVNELKLINLSPATVKKTHFLLDTKLLGYEIIEQTRDSCVIKDSSKESPEEFTILLRRVFLILIELAGQVAINVPSKENMGAEQLDRTMKKLINYCQRLLVKQGHKDVRKVPFYYSFCEELERIGDEYLWLMEHSKKVDMEDLKEANRYLQLTYEIFYNFNMENYNRIQDETHKLKNKVREKKLDKSSIFLHNIARRINSLLGTAFAINFERVT